MSAIIISCLKCFLRRIACRPPAKPQTNPVNEPKFTYLFLASDVHDRALRNRNVLFVFFVLLLVYFTICEDLKILGECFARDLETKDADHVVEQIRQLVSRPIEGNLPTTVLICFKQLFDTLQANKQFQLPKDLQSDFENFKQVVTNLLQVRFMGHEPFVEEEDDENILLGVSTKCIGGGPTDRPSKTNPFEN